jgi:hypothetical protein
MGTNSCPECGENPCPECGETTGHDRYLVNQNQNSRIMIDGDKNCVCCGRAFHIECESDLTTEEYKEKIKDYPHLKYSFTKAFAKAEEYSWEFFLPDREIFDNDQDYEKEVSEVVKGYGFCQGCAHEFENVMNCYICEKNSSLICSACKKIYCTSCIEYFDKTNETKNCCISCCIRHRSFEFKLEIIT